MALAYAGIPVEIREISLREKPLSMLAISPKGTVPVLQYKDLVLEQSLDIMKWALSQHDPDAWITDENSTKAIALINANVGHLKSCWTNTNILKSSPISMSRIFWKRF
jgi:glutathione S-transferase